MPINNNDQLNFDALGAEITQCTEVLHNYSEKVNEGLLHMLEIHRHIAQLQMEQVKLLANVPPLPGLEQ